MEFVEHTCFFGGGDAKCNTRLLLLLASASKNASVMIEADTELWNRWFGRCFAQSNHRRPPGAAQHRHYGNARWQRRGSNNWCLQFSFKKIGASYCGCACMLHACPLIGASIKSSVMTEQSWALTASSGLSREQTARLQKKSCMYAVLNEVYL